jgi:hypothetical protein
MQDRTLATLMWENNPDTPINADNLSKMLDFQASSQYLDLTDTNADYTAWADVTINQAWPDLTSSWDSLQLNVGKKIYNFFDGTVRRYTYDASTGKRTWTVLPSPKNKILKITSSVRFSLSYKDKSAAPHTVGMEFILPSPNTFTIDDLISGTDFDINTKYIVVLVMKYSYSDKAAFKIVKSSEEGNAFITPVVNVSSPTGYDLISWRKVGGFTTNASGQIDIASIWDLFTYKAKIVTDKLLISTTTGVRLLNATDIPVIDASNVLNSAGQNMSIEGAAIQTRQLIDGLRAQFYTNRKFGFSLRFTHIRPNATGYELAPDDSLSLFLSSGYLDVAGNLISKNTPVFFNSTTFQAKINGGATVTAPKLASVDNGNKTVLYPGVWRVFVDYMGVVHFIHEQLDVARWIPAFYGWYSLDQKRCLGKFRVKADRGNYIERFSVTDVHEANTPANEIIVHYGTLVPDGLIPCDGKWHDIYGIDQNAYTWDQLVSAKPNYAWGSSWYEQAPDYTNKVIKGANYPVINVTGGPFNPTTGAGGANDYGNSGGSDAHIHVFEHQHGSGTLNILPSGVHPGHQVAWNGSGETVDVTVVPDGAGQKVSVRNHAHNVVITGGEHTHGSDAFSGMTEKLSGDAAKTDSSSNWAPYREAIICIKK